MATTTKTTDAMADILELERGRIQFLIKGRTPMILARLSEKARHELLLPSPRKNAAARASTLKHDPFIEYRASPYRLTDPDAPTELATTAASFKAAMASAALDLPGASKAQVGRLIYVEGDYIPLYGVPRLFMSIVRSADMNHTPDVRTRAIVPRWACEVTVTYAKPLVTEQQVIRLLAAAGMLSGVGDWRPQKGKGDYGTFELVDARDPGFAEIHKSGKDEQIEALANPVCYDAETEDLLSWFKEETGRRGMRSETEDQEEEEEEEQEPVLVTNGVYA